MKAAVVGAGAWGTALADLLARSGSEVALWALEPDVADSINGTHVNSRFLDGFTLDRGVTATNDVGAAAADAAIILFAPPSFALRAVARDAAAKVGDGAIAVVATKGLEPETLKLMTDVVGEELPGRAVVALSGPSFAAEVASRQPTAVVVASTDRAAAAQVQRAMSGDSFRTYTLDDVTGVELGGALKNVMAVATGIADGLALGSNARAALITRGLAEISRLGVAMGARTATFAGLAGLGDLVLTCTGTLSRNRSLGVAIGEGRTLAEALEGKETVAEGAATARSAAALARRHGVEMPIVDAVCRVLFEGRPPRQALGELMSRELKAEDH